MNNMLIKHFQQLYDFNRMSHAFLICNTFYQNIKDDLEYIFSNYFFDKTEKIFDNPDIIYIKPENGIITKEKIINLQELFKTYSLTNKNRIYIIEEAEKLNQYASNCLLKFLEEPQSNIYAFLITSNVNKILPTIKSRCQLLMFDNTTDNNIKEIQEEVLNNYIDIILLFENNGYDSLPYIYTKINKKMEKEDLKVFIKVLKYFYRDCLNYFIFKELKIFNFCESTIKSVVALNNKEKIINKLFIVINEESKLDYNINVNLCLDRILIEMDGVKND